MLYLAIPAHNEVATIGVLLWRIRTVLAEFPREYEVVVYDDASSDDTAEVAEQYAHAMPVTVLRGATHVGYAGALDALIRHVAAQTRYPRRDAFLLVQGDFTDPPGIVPEFARRFEGGADLVVGDRMVVADAPVAVRRLFKAAHWAMRPFIQVDGVRDLTASMRLIRISALRELVRQAGAAPVCVGDSWTANADLLLKLVPLARRVESVPMEPTYGVRLRDTRRVAVRDALAALKWAWRARGRRAVAGSAAESAGVEGERRPPRGGVAAAKRREDTELSVEKLRERVRDRPRIEDEESFNGRREGRRRERERAQGERVSDEPRESVSDGVGEPAPERLAEKPSAESRAPRPERLKLPRAEAPAGDAKPARPERLPRGERPARIAAPKPPKPPRRPRGESRSPYSDPSIALDDPFAAPAPKRDRSDRTVERALEPADASEPRAEIRPRDDRHDARRDDDVEEGNVGETFEGETAEGETAEGETAEGETAEGETAEGGAPRKKRRRNRRSRRGRARKDGAADGTEEGAAESGVDSTGESATDESATGGDGDDDRSNGSDDTDGDESDLDSAARARRRGRRGRRGGARRSRGRRDKDGGGESGGADAGEGGGGEGGGEG